MVKWLVHLAATGENHGSDPHPYLDAQKPMDYCHLVIRVVG